MPTAPAEIEPTLRMSGEGRDIADQYAAIKDTSARTCRDHGTVDDPAARAAAAENRDAANKNAVRLCRNPAGIADGASETRQADDADAG
jgi:hypothetical protein